jgi:alpha-galactosidase/6-phospho-beta-glucosidase family protein
MGRPKKVTAEVSTFSKRWAKFKNVSAQESVDMFAAKVIAVWENEIRKCENSIDNAVNEYNAKMIELEQKTTEYEQAYLNSFLNIDETSVDTVDKRASFVSRYEDQINRALNALENHKDSVINFTLDHNGYVQLKQDKIERYNDFIAELKNKQ